MAYRPNDDDRNTVRTMAAGGIPQERIARCIGGGITDKTLRKHFRKELDTSLDTANAVAVSNLFQRVQAGNMTAIIFWLKTRAGWRETDRHEHSGIDGSAIQSKTTLEVVYVDADKEIPE